MQVGWRTPIQHTITPHDTSIKLLSIPCAPPHSKAGLVPIHLCATLGTTSTTAVNPIGPLANVANDYGVWVHVDAAYAGSACIFPEFRHHLDGIERVNSLSLSPHEWLLSYLDCCCLWVKQLSEITRSLSTNPEYLNNKAGESDSVVEFKDWQIGTVEDSKPSGCGS